MKIRETDVRIEEIMAIVLDSSVDGTGMRKGAPAKYSLTLDAVVMEITLPLEISASMLAVLQVELLVAAFI